MNQFHHRQQQWLPKFVQQLRESSLASEMFTLTKGLPYERLSQRLLLTPNARNSAFSQELRMISLQKKRTLEKPEN